MYLTDIKVYDVDSLLTDLRRTRQADTVNNVRVAMSKVLTESVRHQLVASNPVKATKKMKRQEFERTGVQRPWSKDEVADVLRALEGSSIGAMVTLLLATGMRLGEAQALHWEQIDFANQTLSIEWTLSHLSLLQPDGSTIHGVSVRPPKTPQSRRIIQLEAPMFEVLTFHKTHQMNAETAAGTKWKDSGYVFTNQLGGPVSASNFRRKGVKLLRDSGLRLIRVHDLRHTFITLLVEESPDLLVPASRAVGHSSIKITTDRYAKTARIADQATKAMSNILFPVEQ